MLRRNGPVSAEQRRHFRGKADHHGSPMARLTAMVLRTMPECPINFRDLGLCRQVARKRRPKSRKPCHNGQPCHREAITVVLVICGLPFGRPSGRPRQLPRLLEAIAVSLAVLTLPAGCRSGRLRSSPCHPEAWRFFASAFDGGRGGGCAEGNQTARREGEGPRERTAELYNKVKRHEACWPVHLSCVWGRKQKTARHARVQAARRDRSYVPRRGGKRSARVPAGGGRLLPPRQHLS